MANMQIRAFDSDSQSQDGSETPRGHRYDRGNVSNLKLVFAEPERGLPSLHRGWRTPDPSPDRTGLPKLGSCQLQITIVNNMVSFFC